MLKYVNATLANITILTIAVAVFVATTDATVRQCSDFEAAVFSLIDDAEKFQLSPEFEELGWEKPGPAGDWMERWEAVNAVDNALHLEFSQNHNFLPVEVLIIANAYRTNTFNSFNKSIQYDILSAKRCRTRINRPPSTETALATG